MRQACPARADAKGSKVVTFIQVPVPICDSIVSAGSGHRCESQRDRLDFGRVSLAARPDRPFARWAGAASEATIEITPRGAAFTLASLSHVGHAAHLALVDACLKGQVRGGSMGIGQDSRAVVASLAAPLVAAYELGLERLTLSDLVLLPPDRAAKDVAGRTATGEATRSADCARFLLRVGERWHWLRGAERFEVAGCAGTPNIGVGEPWHDVIAELPDASEITAQARAGRWPAPILAEVRAPSGLVEAATPERICELRGQALASFARAPVGWHIGPATSLADLGLLLPGLVSDREPYLTSFAWHDATIQVVLTPEPDGYQTLCLLPPPDAPSPPRSHRSCSMLRTP